MGFICAAINSVLVVIGVAGLVAVGKCGFEWIPIFSI